MNAETIRKILSGEVDIEKKDRDDFVEMLKYLSRMYFSRVISCVDGTGESDNEWTALSCIFSRVVEAITEKPVGNVAKLFKTADSRFDICRNIEQVLKIGRDYQNKDGYRGAHYDTVKLLCDAIEYQQEQLKTKTEVGDCAKLREALASPECQAKPLSLDEAIAHADEVAGDCSTSCQQAHKQLADWLRELKAKRSAERGNAAKLREAASDLASIFDCDIQFLERRAKELRDTGAYGGGIIEHILHSITLARAALAAPPRNCDRFGGDIDKLREACARERGLNPEEDFPDVFPDWLLALAREGGAK